MKSKGKVSVNKAEGERRFRPLSWIFYYVLLPIIATALFAAVALQILGYNVIGTLESRITRIAGTHQLLNHGAGSTSSAQTAALRIEVAQKQLTIETLNRKVAALSQQVALSTRQIQSEKTAIQALQAKLAQKQSAAAIAAKQAAIYTNMSSQQAAVILLQLSQSEQVAILKDMSSADAASILADMPAKQAAQLLQAGA
ncbi:magnesium transporter MgtE N-terminal domain-containing protein [Sulfoacidibacillus thermotolerans]|uniref:Magnesium transporter MgtE intracellular domain-containing protein n=1 Tax=Sulfoacidibacillus thermotolerans TaxID=1765684 RepID=A0A2U3DA81_SULT2|nr:hypothetical protein [Sulfoacidibacillus thermotolerans]PWI58190.1 hypothetical protein BM613_04460 [Sulfoacidibacillus thermotolerans]